VFTGGTLWFVLLAFFVSRAHRRVRPQTLTIFVRVCGVVFLIFASLLAYRLFVPAKKTHGVDLIRHAS
jgi:threonine/homoserine/homoserine lactone efflux protein